MAAAITLVIVMIIALSLMVYCTMSIVEAARQGLDTRTRRIQVQLYRTLIAQDRSNVQLTVYQVHLCHILPLSKCFRLFSAFQSLIPFLFIHVPFYLCVLAPLVHVDTGVASDFLPFLFAWSPAINPLIVMYFVRDYRKFVLSKVMRLRRDIPSATNSVFPTATKRP
ncbi:hypothetical protein OSTOST_03244 [Ostertagia ostertagi]